MGNKSNLKPLTTEKAREIGKKGGIASGKKRQERKAFKEALLLALDTKKGNKTIQSIGIDAVLEKYMNGDLEAFKVVRDTVGEKPKDKIETDFEFNIKVELNE